MVHRDLVTFLWGYVKCKIYAKRPTPIQDRKGGINEFIKGIYQPLLDLVKENFLKKYGLVGGVMATIQLKSSSDHLSQKILSFFEYQNNITY